MIKNIHVLFVTTLIIGVSTQFSFAQNEGTTTTSIPVVTEEVLTEVAPSEPVARKGLSVGKQTRIINLAANISNKLEATMTRFDTIIARLERRIEKMEAEGYDVREAKTKLTKAQNSLSAGRSEIMDIDGVVTQMSSSENPKSGWIKVRSSFKSAYVSVRETKQSLKDVITLLRQSKKEVASDISTSSNNAILE
jgi:hypothetical protein